MLTECVESKQPDGEPGRRQPQQRHRARAGRRHDTGSDVTGVTGEHRRAARQGPDPPGLPQHPPYHHRPHADPFQYAHFINSHIGVSFKAITIWILRILPVWPAIVCALFVLPSDTSANITLFAPTDAAIAAEADNLPSLPEGIDSYRSKLCLLHFFNNTYYKDTLHAGVLLK